MHVCWHPLQWVCWPVASANTLRAPPITLDLWHMPLLFCPKYCVPTQLILQLYATADSCHMSLLPLRVSQVTVISYITPDISQQGLFAIPAIVGQLAQIFIGSVLARYLRRLVNREEQE